LLVCRQTGGTAVIGSIDDTEAMVRGEAGTRITPERVNVDAPATR